MTSFDPRNTLPPILNRQAPPQPLSLHILPGNPSLHPNRRLLRTQTLPLPNPIPLAHPAPKRQRTEQLHTPPVNVTQILHDRFVQLQSLHRALDVIVKTVEAMPGVDTQQASSPAKYGELCDDVAGVVGENGMSGLCEGLRMVVDEMKALEGEWLGQRVE